jgi:hypothetical protein
MERWCSPCSAASSRSAAKCGPARLGSSANGGIVISPTTGRAARDEGAELVRGDAGLALLARDVDLDEHLRVRRAVRSSWRSAESEATEWMSSTSGRICLTLRLWSWPMKCQRNVAGPRRLGLELLRAVLAEQRDARLRERAELLERDVLDRGEQLDVAGSRPRGAARDLLAHAVGVARRAAPDQARHTTPAWRPVTPPSRRWEKNSASAHIVHRPGVVDLGTPAARAAARDGGEVEVALAARGRRSREARVDLLADLVAAAAGAGPSAAVIGPSAPSSRSAATPSARMPPASPRQPPCSAATAPRAVSATGEAVGREHERAPRAARWPDRPSSAAGRAADGGSAARARAPRAPAAVQEALAGHADGVRQPLAVRRRRWRGRRRSGGRL